MVDTPSQVTVDTPSQNMVDIPSQNTLNQNTPSHQHMVGTPSHLHMVGTPSHLHTVGTPSHQHTVDTLSQLTVDTPIMVINQVCLHSIAFVFKRSFCRLTDLFFQYIKFIHS